MDITNPTAHEQAYVHDIYQHIAPHFSATRYKPWPIVSRFLTSLPCGSIGLDIGCGNGKYLSVNPNIFLIGSDRSSNLISLSRSNPQNMRQEGGIVADIMDLPHQDGRFDFAISIAVVHHLSVEERRVEAVRKILGCLKMETGRALVYVWALEQKGSRRGWDEGGEQDVFVPWVVNGNSSGGSGKNEKSGGKAKTKAGSKSNGQVIENEDVGVDKQAEVIIMEEQKHDDISNREKEANPVYQRYYHLYRKGELEENVVTAGGEVVESGYEKDNWWAIIKHS